jgi:RNA polymerase II subunit A C-terminal domain phosphatase
MKVDMARRKGGIFILKANWFTDSTNAWEKQDEQLYLLESPPRREHIKSPNQGHTQNVDVEGHDPGGAVQEMLDDFDEDEMEDDADIEAQQELEPITLGTWQDATDEVDAYLMESDSELGDGEEPQNDIILGDGDSEVGRFVH